MSHIIAAGSKLTAKAAVYALKKGGNAIDAAISALLAAPLAEPALTSLGGGGLALIYLKKEKKIIFLDFFVEAPKYRTKPENLDSIVVDFGGAKQTFYIGAASVAIPGLVKGLFYLYKNYATLPFKELKKVAKDYALNGIYLEPLQAYFLKLLEPIYTFSKEARKIFAPNGKLIDENTLFRNEDYANTLEIFEKYEDEIFYKGDIADKIEKIMEKEGGNLRKVDLKNYKVYEKEPIKIHFKDYEIYLSNFPSIGSILIALSLKCFENLNLKPKDFMSLKHILGVIQSLYISQEFRKEVLDKFLKEEKENIKELFNYFEKYEKKFLFNSLGNTTHISIKDKEGNIVSITTTNGEGSGIVIPETGIMLNNMLGEEDLNPFGFFKISPYKRLPSMMCPCIVKKGNLPILALGSAGSKRIRSAIFEVLINYLIFKLNIKEAIDAPRIHVEENTVYMEPGIPLEYISEIEKHGFKVSLFKEKNLYFGGVQAVTLSDGAGDIRRGGVCLIVD